MNINLLIKYTNKWVALSSDRTKVLAVAKNMKQLHDKVKKSKAKDPIYHFVLPSDTTFAP